MRHGRPVTLRAFLALVAALTLFRVAKRAGPMVLQQPAFGVGHLHAMTTGAFLLLRLVAPITHVRLVFCLWTMER